MSLPRFAAAAFAALSLFVPAFARADAPDPRVAQLIAASGEAIGVASLAPVTTMRVDAKVTGVGLSGTLTQYVDLRDGRFAETANLAPLIQIDGYDGRVTWNADGSHLVWNDGSDSGRSSEVNQAYLASYALWRPQSGGAAIAWIGPKTAAGRTYDALSITPAESKVPFELWFDQTTHLPTRANFVNGFISSSLALSDYRRVQGLNFPHAIHLDSSDGNNSDTQITSVAFDPPGAQTALARPQTRPNDFSMQNGKTSTVVPFVLSENHVQLDVMLNGKGPYHFIFDTGGSNVIDPAVAKEIGAFGKGAAQGSGVGSQTETFSFATVAKLQVGDALLTHQPFVVVPTRMGFGVSSGRQVDGLIGWEVLARYVTTFDYANRRVVLSLPGTAAPPAGGHVVPFVFYGTQPQIACTIDGIPAECTIDTGARDTISFMTPFLADHPQIIPAATTAVGVNGFGLGGAALGKLGRVQEVGVDDLKLTNLVADYSTQTSGGLTAPFIAANVGGNLLRRFAVTFDYGNGTMTLVPNAAFGEADAYERSGLFLIRRGASIVVADARPGTPAANAGVVKGDAIASVNGTPVGTMPLYAIRALFGQAPGTVVTLGITSKDGTQRSVKFTLQDYV